MDVKIDITSTLTVNNGVALSDTKAGATAAKSEKAWMAVAAAVAANDFNADGSKTDTASLTEASDNIITFAFKESSTTDAEAKQSFYLAKATGAAEYKVIKAGTAAKVPQAAEVGATTLYKLTAIGTQPTSNAELTTALVTSDVYEIATASVPAAEAAGVAITKLAKGSTATSWANTNTYYTAAEVKASAIQANDLIMYASKTTADAAGKAEFKYVGALGEGTNGDKQWTSADIKNVSIAYTINGITSTTYTAKMATAGDVVYGYDVPVKDLDPTGFASGDTFTLAKGGSSNELTVNLGAGNKVTTIKQVDLMFEGTPISLVADKDYTLTSGNKIKLLATETGGLFTDGAAGTYTIRVTYQNDAYTETTCVFTAN